MKKRALSGFIIMAALAGTAGADLVYSNDFAGTEFKATGVGAVEFFKSATANGVLYATASGTGVGLRVNMEAFNLDTDSDVTAVKFTATLKTPKNDNTAGWIGFGWSDSGTYNLATSGLPWFRVMGNTHLAYGGVGAINSRNTSSASILPDKEIDVSYIYYKDGTFDLEIAGTKVADRTVLTHSTTPKLNFAHIHLRSLGDYDSGDGYVKSFTIEVISEPVLVGLYKYRDAGAVAFPPSCLDGRCDLEPSSEGFII